MKTFIFCFHYLHTLVSPPKEKRKACVCGFWALCSVCGRLLLLSLSSSGYFPSCHDINRVERELRGEGKERGGRRERVRDGRGTGKEKKRRKGTNLYALGLYVCDCNQMRDSLSRETGK